MKQRTIHFKLPRVKLLGCGFKPDPQYPKIGGRPRTHSKKPDEVTCKVCLDWIKRNSDENRNYIS